MNLELPASLVTAIGENVVGPPTFEVSAAPNRSVLQLLDLERAIDPTTAGPLRRTNVPVRMIIERNQENPLRDSTNPKRAQVMKIARAIEQKRRDAPGKFPVELFDQSRR